jgi:hypothetical protein
MKTDPAHSGGPDERQDLAHQRRRDPRAAPFRDGEDVHQVCLEAPQVVGRRRLLDVDHPDRRDHPSLRLGHPPQELTARETLAEEPGGRARELLAALLGDVRVLCQEAQPQLDQRVDIVRRRRSDRVGGLQGRTRYDLRPLLARDGEEPVVLPLTADLHEGPGCSLPSKAVLLEDPYRGGVSRHHAGLHPVQTQRRERVAEDQAERLGRDPSARLGAVDVVADDRRLKGSAHDVVQADAPDETFALLEEDPEQEVGSVLGQLVAPLDLLALRGHRHERAGRNGSELLDAPAVASDQVEHRRRVGGLQEAQEEARPFESHRYPRL